MIGPMLTCLGKPYYWRKRRVHWIARVYEIMYEETVVLELTASQHQLCKDIVSAMNMAHQVGAIDAWCYLDKLKQAV